MKEELEVLSEKIMSQIMRLWPTVSNTAIHEIQFDCDWTQSTKEKYFKFLRHFRQLQNDPTFQLSATIRLHQIKFANQTGVPPVNRGMLMFYNMADLESIKTPNSILDLEVAHQYIDSQTTYELPLDFALPIFSLGCPVSGEVK